MATRGTIVVAIPKSKWGKTYKFPQGENEFDTPEVTIPEGAKYVSVYHHWDSYPNGLGKDLLEFKDIDKILTEVIAGGDMSYIGKPYHAWRNEDWDDAYGGVRPKFSEDIPDRTEEYQYLRTQRGTWKVRSYGSDKFEGVKSLITPTEVEEVSQA